MMSDRILPLLAIRDDLLETRAYFINGTYSDGLTLATVEAELTEIDRQIDAFPKSAIH